MGILTGLDELKRVPTCCRAIALRDFYPFWKTRNERSRAGKLLLLDPADTDTIQARPPLPDPGAELSCIRGGLRKRRAQPFL